MSESEQAINNIAPPKSYSKLLIEFNNKNKHKDLPKGELLKFNIENGSLTVYNPAPVIIDGQMHLWTRVEKKATEKDSTIRLFKETEKGDWKVVDGTPVFKNLQDPFYCGTVDGYHILGGVHVYDVIGSPYLGYRTVFYCYRNSLNELTTSDGEACSPFAVGPEKMKDIRIIQTGDGRISVMTRPQGEFGGNGRIGYFELKSLDLLERALADYDLKKDEKTLLNGMFVEEEWGGANELFNLTNGRIGVLGHIAGFGKDGKKNYYPLAFTFNPQTRSFNNLQIITTAKQFPPVNVKKSDLGDVCFSGGLVSLGNGTSWLYVGIGDTKAGRILIKDPF